jgi:chemotaxis methyl-accepting protein methylase
MRIFNLSDLQNIIDFLHDNHGFDFSGYRKTMLNRRIHKRLSALKLTDFAEYNEYLEHNSSELDALVDVLTINFSQFFRNTFTFEYFTDHLLTKLILEKYKSKDRSLRIWSSGCAAGEEPYSIAILIKEIFEKEKLSLNTTIIATDIDKESLNFAKKGVYSSESIVNVKHSLVEKYFKQKENVFQLKPEIKQMIRFS